MRRQHPANFRHAADRGFDHAVEIGETDIANEASSRFLLDRPIAEAEQRPEAAIAQKPGPAFIGPHRLSADIMGNRPFRPHGHEVRKIIDVMRTQPESCCLENGYDHQRLRPSNFLNLTCPGWKPSTQRILIDAMAMPFGAFASPNGPQPHREQK